MPPRRYAALNGELNDASDAESKQAAADRDRFGCEYIPHGAQNADKPALVLRFMHEVRNIPLWQARECAVAIIQQNNGFEAEGWDAPEAAAQLLNETGNILVAEASAALFIAASEGTRWESFWEKVLEVLRYGQPFNRDGHGPGASVH